MPDRRADGLGDAAMEAVVGIFGHGRDAGLDFDHPVPGVVSTGIPVGQVVWTGRDRHVPILVVARRDPRGARRLADVGDLVDLVHRTILVEVGGAGRFLHVAGPVAQRIERPVFFAHGRAADAGLGTVQRATIRRLETMQAVVGVEFVEIDRCGKSLADRVFAPGAIRCAVIAAFQAVDVGGRAVSWRSFIGARHRKFGPLGHLASVSASLVSSLSEIPHWTSHIHPRPL